PTTVHSYGDDFFLAYLGRIIEPQEDEDSEPSEEALEPKEEVIEEESQPADYVVHALAGYSNPSAIELLSRLLFRLRQVGYRRGKGVILLRLQRKIAAGSCLPQGSLLAAIKEDGSKRSLLATLGSERCVLWLKGQGRLSS
ncbi:hypothetical protein BHM03_00059717, partial [Ensete ventricosum]